MLSASSNNPIEAYPTTQRRGKWRRGWMVIAMVIVALAVGGIGEGYGQMRSTEGRYKVEGGKIVEKSKEEVAAESYHYSRADSLAADSLRLSLKEYGLLMDIYSSDSTLVAEREEKEKLTADSLARATLSKREQKKFDRELRYADSAFVRHSKVFRDSMPISRVVAISMIAPGFGQLYNRQAWKIPVLYTTVAASTFLWQREQKEFKRHKRLYDFMTSHPNDFGREDIDPVQRDMIRKNTSRQIFMFGAFASYIYFLGDAAVNHPGTSTSVKKATTLSTIFPGAGQIYNRSYWKVPIVIGAFASMIYVVDWNNRGYKRFDTAYKLRTDGDPNTLDEFSDSNNVTPQNMLTYKRMYRRNRDLAIILTGALYLLNIIDAHSDAHMKDYDISDDLSFELQPSLNNLYTSKGGSVNTVGFSLRITF